MLAAVGISRHICLAAILADHGVLEVMRVEVVVHRVHIDVDGRLFLLETVDVTMIVVRQFAGTPKAPADLQEAEAHQ